MRAAMAALLLALGLVSSPAEAAWPKYLNFQTCFDYLPCTGLTNTWIVYEDGSFTDQYGGSGTWLFANKFPGQWYYGVDWILLYDTGAALKYEGDLEGTRTLIGPILFFDPMYGWIPVGSWCTDVDPLTGEC
jgi:hypothetical protein